MLARLDIQVSCQMLSAALSDTEKNNKQNGSE